MSLPIVGYRDVLKALKKMGFYPTRQSGSHIILENGRGVWTVVPRKKELGKGLVLKIACEPSSLDTIMKYIPVFGYIPVRISSIVHAIHLARSYF